MPDTDRLDRIEALLRDREFHEPGCPVRGAEVYNDHGLLHRDPGHCNCWLNEDEANARVHPGD